MNEYPYPVLLEMDSSYKDDVMFSLEFDKEFFSSKEVSFRFKVTLNSKYLLQHIDDGKLNVVIKLQSNIYITTTKVNIGENVIVKIPTDKLMNNDTLRFTAYILASEEFELQYHDELIDIYDGNYKECVKKNSVLAISNQETLSYNPSNNDFIKFAVDDAMKGKCYRIGFSDKHINVYVSSEFNVAYGRLKSFPDSRVIFDAHIIFEVFVYALVEMVQRDNIEEEWYQLFIQMIEQQGESFDDFKNRVRDDNNVQIEEVYALAHLLTNYYIEKSVIMITQRED